MLWTTLWFDICSCVPRSRKTLTFFFFFFFFFFLSLSLSTSFFQAISSCNNHAKCVAFLADLENNLEVALESFYELSDAEKAEFFQGVAAPAPPVLDLVGNDGGGMIEEPIVRKQLSVVEISLFRAHFKVTRRDEL